MKRWHEEFCITYREWKRHYLDHVENNIEYVKDRVGKDPYEIDCVCDEQIGRFRKRRARDCGTPRCRLCHRDKYPRRQRTYQELRADLKLHEGLDEKE